MVVTIVVNMWIKYFKQMLISQIMRVVIAIKVKLCCYDIT